MLFVQCDVREASHPSDWPCLTDISLRSFYVSLAESRAVCPHTWAFCVFPGSQVLWAASHFFNISVALWE